MLKDILNLIYKSRLFSVSIVAEKLGIEESMVEDLINQLLYRNYIIEEKSEFGCDSNKCSSCTMTCKSQIPIKTYSLTEKGLKYVKQPV